MQLSCNVYKLYSSRNTLLILALLVAPPGPPSDNLQTGAPERGYS